MLQLQETPQQHKRKIITAEIERTIRILHRPGEVFEIRFPKIAAGYFNDPAIAANGAFEFERKHKPAGTYVTLNPINPVLLARSQNRITPWLKDTTADLDVLCRRWLMIDIDPVRPSGISSTNAELQLADDRACDVVAYLAGKQFDEPISIRSGNGHHLIYRVDDLPNTPEMTAGVRQLLSRLAADFSDRAVSIDTQVGKPSQMTKLCGTTARKGSNMPDRPHRMAELLYVPAAYEPKYETAYKTDETEPNNE